MNINYPKDRYRDYHTCVFCQVPNKHGSWDDKYHWIDDPREEENPGEYYPWLCVCRDCYKQYERDKMKKGTLTELGASCLFSELSDIDKMTNVKVEYDGASYKDGRLMASNIYYKGRRIGVNLSLAPWSGNITSVIISGEDYDEHQRVRLGQTGRNEPSSG